MIQERFVKDFESSIKSNWNLPALSDYEGATRTYGQMGEKILWLHYIYEKSHIKKGDKIALIGKNSAHWAITYLATVTYGAVIVPILPDFKPADIHHIVNHSDSIFFFVQDSIFENLDESQMPNLEAIFSLDSFSLLHHKKAALVQIVDRAGNEYLQKWSGKINAESFQFPEIKNDDLAAVVYTSGTTGFSKGVMLPHNSISANIRFAQRNMPLKKGHRIVCFMPLAHAYGCAFEFLFPMTLGCHITFLGKIPSPKILVTAFQSVKPQLILSVPLIIEKIYKKQILPAISKKAVKFLFKMPIISKTLERKIRTKLMDVFGNNFFEIVIGGASFNQEVELFLRKIGFPFTNGYGMTECGPLISYAAWNVNKAFAVGRAVDTLEVKIDSPNAQSIVGEILVRGENVMSGYYKNPQASREAIDNEGWLHTGDLGLIDKDGFIYIKGRSKNMILGPSGQNIYPEEVEAKLNNMPFVGESLVIEKNNKLIALVNPDVEAADQAGLDEANLASKMEENRKLLNESLPAFANVTRIDLYPEEFEKTPTKKIKRYLYNVAE
ncbi:MAG: long-chain fatty acid--CoA ligase [Calditrichaeota bacterium]|nr:MAG: long-chain fatty acid--CoA ligase [Calditrichota bacterium]